MGHAQVTHKPSWLIKPPPYLVTVHIFVDQPQKLGWHRTTPMRLLTIFSALCLGTGVLGSPANLSRRTSRTSAPSGCLTVGTGGTYSTIGAALTALGSATTSACIYIASGTYTEQLKINYAGALTIYGQTSDTGTYKSNTVTITHTITSSAAGTLDLSATVNVVSDGFKMYNINVVNGYGKGSQAVA